MTSPAPVAHRGELVDAVETRVARRGDQARPHPVDEPAPDGRRVEALASGLDVDLGEDLPDRELVELARQHDGGPIEPGGVEQEGCLHAQVGEITGVEAHADRLEAGIPQFAEHRDRVGHAGAQRVDRVHEQDALVGIGPCEGPERDDLPSRRPLGRSSAVQREVGLYHRVRVRAPGLTAERDGGLHVRGGDTAADERGSRPLVDARTVPTTHAELEHRRAADGVDDARCFGGDQRRVVAHVQHVVIGEQGAAPPAGRPRSPHGPARPTSTTPAVASSSAARSPSPGRSSTARVADHSTDVVNPARRASSAVAFTHTSAASPHTTTPSTPRSRRNPASPVGVVVPVAGSST